MNMTACTNKWMNAMDANKWMQLGITLSKADLCLLVMPGDILIILLLLIVALCFGHHQLLVLLCCQSLVGPPGSCLQAKGNFKAFDAFWCQPLKGALWAQVCMCSRQCQVSDVGLHWTTC